LKRSVDRVECNNHYFDFVADVNKQQETIDNAIRYDTKEKFNVDTKAKWSA